MSLYDESPECDNVVAPLTILDKDRTSLPRESVVAQQV
jgi:hypothetical protein